MKSVNLLILVFLVTGCLSTKPVENEHIGTWELVSNTITRGDSVDIQDLTGKRMIKMFNGTHFAFMNHDLGTSKEPSFVAGGGKYNLSGVQYREFLEYCNYREWEGQSFEFTLKVKGDTLIQTGYELLEHLGINQKIEEVYVRIE